MVRENIHVLPSLKMTLFYFEAEKVPLSQAKKSTRVIFYTPKTHECCFLFITCHHLLEIVILMAISSVSM
jgi:hypothetical protein